MAGRFSVEAIFKAVDRVTAPVSRMQQRVGKFSRAVERGLRRADRALSSFVSGLRGAASAALRVGGVGVGLLAAGVGLLVREFSKVENAEAAFTPLLGGVERAREAVQALNDTAATTPFQFETLASAANQLLPVMDGNIENTIKTVRMLGDTAGGSAQKLDSITRGYTKAMLKGKVDMESLNMIAEAGVPIFQDLAAVMGVKVGTKFFKMISAGKVTTEQLTKAFGKLTSEGGKFHNGMAIASRTTSGMWSTLKDNISLTAAELGGVLAPIVKDLIAKATTIAQRVREWVKTNRALIETRVRAFVERAKEALSGMVTKVKELNGQHSLLDRLLSIIVGVSKAFIFLSEHGATIAKVTAAVVALSIVTKILTGAMWLLNVAMTANPVGLIIVGVAALIAAFAALWTWIDEIAAKFDGMPIIFKIAFAQIYLLVKAIQWLKANMGTIVDKAQAAMNWVGGLFGGDESPTAEGGGAPAVVSPQDRTARSIEDRRTTSTSEVTIRDETGRAEVTKGQTGAGVQLQPVGAF